MSKEVEKTPDNIEDEFTEILASLNGLKLHFSSVINQIKSLEKTVKKKMKQQPNVAIPIDVSDKLSSFMGLKEGQQVARMEVTKYIMDYIKINNLLNPNNNQYIVPDSKLNTLFSDNSGSLTYFNMQKHINKHFITKS
jgi:chromatin remodeling complex protein RSC6